MDGPVKHIAIWVALVLCITIAGCTRVSLSLDKVPANTPKGAKIYVAGSFNNWNPGDPNYQMRYDETTHRYVVDLPMGFGSVEYKFTRGDWTTVETDPCGGEKTNRKLIYGKEERGSDTIRGWDDLDPEGCERVTLIIKSIPANTPAGASIYLGGNINGWQCNRDGYKFVPMAGGQYMLTIPRSGDKMEYKLTRGTWETAELNETGDEQLQRELYFGKQDTIWLTVNAWMDKPLQRVRTYTIMIQSLPAKTPAKSDLYLTGNFNNWNPIDRNYKFATLPNGKKIITVKHSGNEPLTYKVTRGGWQSVENDEEFDDIRNRTIWFNEPDTIKITIINWADMAPAEVKRQKLTTPEPEAIRAIQPSIGLNIKPPQPADIQPLDYDRRKKVFIIIDKLPEMEKEDQVFLAGDFNNWNGGDPNYTFRTLANGKRVFLLRLADYNAHEFKITRGSWSSEEVALNMEKIRNRVISHGPGNDTIHIKVENWIDYTARRKLVMLLTYVPENTPMDEGVYLTGDFNNWDPHDEKYRFIPLGGGRMVLSINNFSKKFGWYKITRGSWPTEAVNKKGGIPDNQAFEYIKNDTIKLRIERWRDLK
jgi:hypothetical protein